MSHRDIIFCPCCGSLAALKFGAIYYSISKFGAILRETYRGSSSDMERLRAGNVFLSEIEAEAYKAKTTARIGFIR